MVGVSFFITEIDFEFAVSGYEADERCSPSDVATAAGGGLRERKEAPRSKFIGAPSRNELWAPQEAF